MKVASVSNKNLEIINKPIIKERNSSKIDEKHKKFFSPEQRGKEKKIFIPHLNFNPIQNLNNANSKNYHKIYSFRETFHDKISINSFSSIKSINIHYDENEYDENDDNNDYYQNFNIIYTIKCFDNKTITCEYNCEKDSVVLIIKNLKQIMNIDVNDIVLLKNEFDKKIHSFMDRKKLQIFFNKYYMIINKFKLLGNMWKKFDRIINGKKLKNDENNSKIKEITEKIKDFQLKKNIINKLNNNIMI